MYLLALDLSLKCSGWAKFSKDGKLMKKGRIIPSTDISNHMKIHYVTSKVKELFTGIETLVVEDTYIGQNPKTGIWLTRLGGAVITAWIDFKYKDPILYKAVSARKLVGIKGNCHKAEAQIFVLSKYKYASCRKIADYQLEIVKYQLAYKNKELKKGAYTYRMDKLTKKIDEETGIGEDVADCFDHKTEILTNKGWKLFKDLNYKDKVLSMNPKTEKAKYYPIKNIIKQKYNGLLYTYKTKTLDFAITPNHKLYIRDKNNWKFRPINSLNLKSKNNWNSKRVFNWKGEYKKDYIIPELKYSNKNNKMIYLYKELKLSMNDWLEFLGWYISEGNLIRSRGNINSICITQSNKNNKQKIKKLLKKLDFDYKSYTKKGGQAESIIVNSPQLARLLSKICYVTDLPKNSLSKKIPMFVFELSSEQIQKLINTLCLGDGWYDKRAEALRYSTSSEKLADDVQVLFMKSKKYASIIERNLKGKEVWFEDHWIKTQYTCYLVSEYKRQNTSIKNNNIKLKKYKGFVYCVEVEPYHLVYTRRNKKAHWTGNSIVVGLAYLNDKENK